MRSILTKSLCVAVALGAGIAIGRRASPPPVHGAPPAKATVRNEQSVPPADENKAQPPAIPEVRVKPVSVTGLPEGIALTGRASWSGPMRFANGKMLKPGLGVILEFWGDSAPLIRAYGMHWVDTIKTGEGETLNSLDMTACSMEPSGLGLFNPLPEDEKRFNPENETDFPDCTYVQLEFEHPGKAATAIAEYSASLKLQIARDVTTIVVPNVLSFLGRHIDNAELDAAHLRFRVVEGERGIEVACIAGDPRRIGMIMFVDEKGMDVDFVSYHRSDDRSFRWSEVQTATGVKLTIYSELQESTLAFRFVDMPIPSSRNRLFELRPVPFPQIVSEPVERSP